MSERASRPLRRLACAAALCPLANLACSDDATIVEVAPPAPVLPAPGDEGSGPAAPEPGPTEPGPTEPSPVYALQTYVFTPDDSVLSYVTLTHSLDVTELPRDAAREFAGYAFITVVDGKLLVSDGESPVVTRYEITDDLEWRELDAVSFANQGVTGGGAGFERHWFQSPDTAYVTLDVTKRVIWNPTEMRITGVMEDSALEFEREGLVLDATFNRQPRVLRGPVLKPFYYRDADWFRFGGTTAVAVYDPETHAERSIVDVPCPALEVPSQDEVGNTYFSSWTYGATLGLFGLGPPLCVRRITPESTLDETWTPDLTAWTGGRPVKTFRYMRDGKAVATVLHTDELDIDFSQPYSEEASLEVDRHWRLWLFDLEAQAARPIDGIGRIDSAFLWSNFDGRTFVFVPVEDWSRSQVYELDTDGNATAAFETTGVVNEWVQVR